MAIYNKPQQGRTRGGQFAPVYATEGKRAPKTVSPPVPYQKQETTSTNITALPKASKQYVADVLTISEVLRYEKALSSAVRTAHTPADRMALKLERETIERRFGAINWDLAAA